MRPYKSDMRVVINSDTPIPHNDSDETIPSYGERRLSEDKSKLGSRASQLLQDSVMSMHSPSKDQYILLRILKIVEHFKEKLTQQVNILSF